jgi:hypothetical protein
MISGLLTAPGLPHSLFLSEDSAGMKDWPPVSIMEPRARSKYPAGPTAAVRITTAKTLNKSIVITAVCQEMTGLSLFMTNVDANTTRSAPDGLLSRAIAQHLSKSVR